MERFIIGTCRTRKIITSHPDLDDLVTFEEIFDAMAVLTLLSVKEYRQDRTSKVARHLDKEGRKLVKQLKDNRQWDIQKQKIQATTSFDILRYAERLLRPEFKV
jgi:hypothetical protein